MVLLSGIMPTAQSITRLFNILATCYANTFEMDGTIDIQRIRHAILSVKLVGKESSWREWFLDVFH